MRTLQNVFGFALLLWGMTATGCGKSTPPKPKALESMDLIMQRKGLRKDGPHHRKPAAKNRSSQDRAE